MNDAPLRLEERVFGSPATFAIWTAFEPGQPRTGYFTFIVQGRRIGDPKARTTFALQSGFFAEALESQLKPWPENMAEVVSPRQTFDFLRGVYSGGISTYGFASPFHDCVLTNNLAEPFDGLFVAVRRVTGNRLWILEEEPAAPTGVRCTEVPIDAYKNAVSAFVAAHDEG